MKNYKPVKKEQVTRVPNSDQSRNVKKQSHQIVKSSDLNKEYEVTFSKRIKDESDANQMQGATAGRLFYSQLSTPQLAYNEPHISNMFGDYAKDEEELPYIIQNNKTTFNLDRLGKEPVNSTQHSGGVFKNENEFIIQKGSLSMSSLNKNDVTYQSLSVINKDFKIRNEKIEFPKSFSKEFNFNFTRRAFNHSSLGQNQARFHPIKQRNMSKFTSQFIQQNRVGTFADPRNSTFPQKKLQMELKQNPYQQPQNTNVRDKHYAMKTTDGLTQIEQIKNHMHSQGRITQILINDSDTKQTQMQTSQSILNLKSTGTGFVQNVSTNMNLIRTLPNLQWYQNNSNFNHKRKMTQSVTTIHNQGGNNEKTMSTVQQKRGTNAFDKSKKVQSQKTLLDQQSKNKQTLNLIEVDDNKSTLMQTKDELKSNNMFVSHNDQFNSLVNDISIVQHGRSLNQGPGEPFILKMNENFSLNLPNDQKFKEMGKEALLNTSNRQKKSSQKSQLKQIQNIQKMLATKNQYNSLSQRSKQKLLNEQQEDDNDSIISPNRQTNMHSSVKNIKTDTNNITEGQQSQISIKRSNDQIDHIQMINQFTNQSVTLPRIQEKGSGEQTIDNGTTIQLNINRSQSVLPEQRHEDFIQKEQTNELLRSIYEKQMFQKESRRTISKLSMNQTSKLQNTSDGRSYSTLQQTKFGPSLLYVRHNQKSTTLKLVNKQELKQTTNPRVQKKLVKFLRQLLDVKQKDIGNYNRFPFNSCSFIQPKSRTISPKYCSLANPSFSQSCDSICLNNLTDVNKQNKKSVMKLWSKYEDKKKNKDYHYQVHFYKQSKNLKTHYSTHIDEYKNKLQLRKNIIFQKIEEEFDKVLENKQFEEAVADSNGIKDNEKNSTINDEDKDNELDFDSMLEVNKKNAKQELIESEQIIPLRKMDYELRSKIYKYGYNTKDRLIMNDKLVSLDQGVLEQHMTQNKSVEQFKKQLNQRRTSISNLIKDQDDKVEFKKHVNKAIYINQLGKSKKMSLNQVINVIHKRQKQDKQTKEIKFREWQKKMWKIYHKNLQAKELQSRPKYMTIYKNAAIQHIKPFQERLQVKAQNEQDSKENFWRMAQTVSEFREAIKTSFSELTDKDQQDQFLEQLIVVNDSNDRQSQFYDDIRQQKFVSKQKSTFDRIHDGEQQPMNNSESIKEKTFVDELMNIRSRSQFLQKSIKTIFDSNDQFADNELAAKYKYAQECHKNNALALSSMIVVPEIKSQNRYILIDVSLTEEQGLSLGNSFKEFGINVSQLYLFNNHISGKAFSNFLQQLNPQQKKSLKGIVYGGNNNLTPEVLDVLKDHYFGNLKELKLLGVQLKAPHLMPKLLDYLKVDMQLHVLSLSKLQMDYQCAENIATMLESKPLFLKELDLSWNKFTPKGMSLICQSFQGNNLIESLNLSHNIIDKNDRLGRFGNYIRGNYTLQHLNLNGVLRTHAQVKRIVKKCKKSQSLLSVHLSATPVIVNDKLLKRYIQVKLQADLPNYLVSPQKRKAPTKLQLKSQIGSQISITYNNPDEIAEKHNWKNKYQLVTKAKTQQKLKIYHENMQIEQHNDYIDKVNKKLVLQRVVAHPEMLDHKMKWTLNKDCYVCKRDKYTLFVTSNPNIRMKSSLDLLYTKDCSDIKFTDIREFARTVLEQDSTPEQIFKDYMRMLPGKERQKINLDIVKVDQLKLRLEQQDILLYQEHTVWLSVIQKLLSVHNYQLIHMMDDFFTLESHAKRIKNWSYQKLYVFSDYVRHYNRIEKIKFINKVSGKESVIKSESYISEVRDENMPKYAMDKIVKDKQVMPFIQAKSIFKGWQKDTTQSLKLTLKYDFEYWKGNKVLKNQKDLEECQDLIQERFKDLKDIFTNLMSGDSYPFIGWIDFGNFCRNVDIQDSLMNGPTIDNIFFATKFNPQIGGESKQLFRHEFLETLVRLSFAKYFQTGIASSPVEALNMIINLIIEKYQLSTWQEFRDDLLWTNFTDKLLKQNITNLGILYEKLFPRYNGSNLKRGFQNCIEMMIKTPGIMISEKEVRFCFGMSKMTVANEVTKFVDYFQPKLVEFYEFLGRAASCKFSDMVDMPFHIQLEKFLKIIFNEHGLKYSEVGDEIVNDESSDESVILDIDEVQRMDTTKLDIYGDSKLFD